MIQEALDKDNNIGMENKNADYEALEKIEGALAKGEYKTAFRLFQRNIIGILCRDGILDVCSPYYRKSGRVKEDKVAAELIGAFQYYAATNDGIRSFRPHEKPFRCGHRTASFMGTVKKFVELLAKNQGSDPWEIYCKCMDDDYFDLENYLDQAEAYAFPHNRHSREVTGKALARYVEKYYGNIDAGEFIGLYQSLDRVYTTFGFPFACTHNGWFFAGYDVLYRKILEEGAWTLHDFWQQEIPGDWLKEQMGPYGIQPSYNNLIEALQDPGCGPLLFRIFPFRMTEDTLRAGCDMDADGWEEFTLMLAKVLHFAECCIGKKNVQENMVQDAVKAMNGALDTIRNYMNDGMIQ